MMLLMSVLYDIFYILGYLVLGLWDMMLLMSVLYDIFYILGYLVLGLWAMMILMSVLYDIPELNIGFHFYMKSDKDDDEERTALKSSIEKTAGSKYIKHVDEENTAHTGVQDESSKNAE